jgi:predicted transcriptional regulator
MYREVTMIEFREVLRLWHEQVPKKRIAAQLGLDPKTVRRYLSAAEAAGLRQG